MIKPAIIKRINTDIDGSRSMLTWVKPMILQVADQKNKAPRNNNKFDFIIQRFQIKGVNPFFLIILETLFVFKKLKNRSIFFIFVFCF